MAANQRDSIEKKDGENSEGISFPGVFGFPLTFGKIQPKPQKKIITEKKREPFFNSKVLSDVLCGAIRDLPGVTKEQENDLEKEGEENLPGLALSRTKPQLLGDDEPPPFFIPKAECFSFEAHAKSVTCISLNSKNTMLASGSRDAEVHFWDFNGMTSGPTPFRVITPIANHSIRSVAFSISGAHTLCAAGDAVCRIYDLNGHKCQETVKGDMYVRDLSQTKGHTHTITECGWHPFDREKFFTASEDATVRIFDINSKPYGVDQALPHVHLLKAINKSNLNIAGQCRVTSCCWAPYTAKILVAGCSDGSLQLWNERKAYGKPDKVVRLAHAENTEVSDIDFLKNEITVISRGTDSTMKVWDLRNFRAPVMSWSDLENDTTGLGLCLNGEETLVATGTTSETNEATLEIFNVTTGDKVDSLKIKASSSLNSRHKAFGVTRVLWPEDLHQLVLSCSDGTLRFFYDKDFSKKGALTFSSRAAPSRKKVFQGFQTPIFTMDSLPREYKETRFGKICRVKPRDTDLKVAVSSSKDKQLKSVSAPSDFFSGKPEGAEKKIGIFSAIAKEDPVVSIRAYAEKAAAEPIFIGPAYKDAQPVPILDYSMEAGDDEKLVSLSNSCPRCGLKLCQCGYMTLSNAIGKR